MFSMIESKAGQKITVFIKIISTILITGAVCLELWNIYSLLNDYKIPNSLTPIFWIERFALIAHLFEGIIAAIYANFKSRSPLQYGIYTFFVGTVGLMELFKHENE